MAMKATKEQRAHSKGTRWLALWKDSAERPVIYIIVSISGHRVSAL